jgi:hypothetical protein
MSPSSRHSCGLNMGWRWGRVRMRKRYLVLGLTLAVACVASVGYVVQGARLYQRYHLAYADYRFIPTGPCDALVAWSPPSVLYTGLYVNQPSLLTLRYRSSDPQTLHITVTIPDLTLAQTLEVQAAQAFQQLAFKPPLLGGNVLDSLVSVDQRQAEIQLSVQGAGGSCTVTSSVLLKSRLWMRWTDPATGADNSDYLAGWVTPLDPSITSLIESAETSSKATLTGYLTKSPNEVVREVNALFNTLQSVYQVHYAPTALTTGVDDAQRIQLPRDVLDNPAHIAMCVETTAILASAVERLGMLPYIIIVPGHAFLGVALGGDASAQISYWETSDLNGSDGAQANIEGTHEYDDAIAHNQLERVVNIQLERQHGIQPID